MRQNNKDIVRTVAANLVVLRKHLNYSQTGMANYLRVDPSTYSKNENAKCIPCMSSLKRLCTALNVSMNWLLFNKGEMFMTKQVPTAPKADPLKKYTAVMPNLIEMLDCMLDDDLLCSDVIFHYQKTKKI